MKSNDSPGLSRLGSEQSCTILSEEHTPGEYNFNYAYLSFLSEKNDYFLNSFYKGKSFGCGEGMTYCEERF